MNYPNIYRNMYDDGPRGGAPRNGEPIDPDDPRYKPPAGSKPPADDSGPATPAAPTGPVATDPGFASPQGGPAGVGGSGGYGFTNLAQYMYANPTATTPGSGLAPTPTGYQSGDYNTSLSGFAPNGAYTPGMAAVDNSLNAVYGRSGTPSTPTLSTPPQNQSNGGQPYPNIYDNMNKLKPPRIM